MKEKRTDSHRQSVTMKWALVYNFYVVIVIPTYKNSKLRLANHFNLKGLPVLFYFFLGVISKIEGKKKE